MSHGLKRHRESHRLQTALRRFYNSDPSYFQESHRANQQLTPERADAFAWIKTGERVLDVGCGTCENAFHLGSRVRFHGCDLSRQALQSARSMGVATRLVQGEGHQLPFLSDSFDVVLSTYALEHFVFPRESLDEFWRVCRPGGRLILLSPAYDNPFQLPPSIGHWSRPQRLRLIAAQMLRSAIRHLDRNRFFFAGLSQPRVLTEAYQSDFDAVHLVSAREVRNYLIRKGSVVLFQRRRTPRPRGQERFSLRERLRNLSLRFGLGEFGGLNLQIVAAKPPVTPTHPEHKVVLRKT